MSKPQRPWWRSNTSPQTSNRPGLTTTSPPKERGFSSGTLTWDARHGVAHHHVSRDTRRITSLQAQTNASTAASLRVAEHTKAVAHATLQELSLQADSLGRTKASLQTAEHGVEESEKTLATIQKWYGCFSFPSCFPRSASRRSNELRTPTPTRETALLNRTTSTALVTLSSKTEKEEDTATAAISNALDYLQQASNQMGEHLDEQTRTIDDVAVRSEKLNARISNAERSAGR